MILEENFARHLIYKAQYGGPGNGFPGFAYIKYVKTSQQESQSGNDNGILYSILLASVREKAQKDKKSVKRAGIIHLNQLLLLLNLLAQEKALLSSAQSQEKKQIRSLSFSFIFENLFLLNMYDNSQLMNTAKLLTGIFIKKFKFKKYFSRISIANF